MADPRTISASLNPGQIQTETPASLAQQSQDGHSCTEPQKLYAVLSELREVHKLREDFHREEKSLTLRIKAIDRRLSQATSNVTASDPLPENTDDGATLEMPSAPRMPHTNGEDRARALVSTRIALPDENGGQEHCDAQNPLAPSAFFIAPELFEARQIIHLARLKYERRMKKLAKELPIYEWMKAINGFGELGLAQIIAETGNLSNYANPAKVWKRMGLAVFEGKSQRKARGEEGILQGYSPRRRSLMYCIGDSLIKKQNEYRDTYLERKEFEKQKLPDAKPIHPHRRAQRYMEKRLLRNLWREWHRVA